MFLSEGAGRDALIRLVGIDVDGTLLGSSGEVDPRVWQVASRARAVGIRLALCSGRPAFGSTAQYVQRLDADGWHIFQNGASIVNAATGCTRSAHLPPRQVKDMITRARGSHHHLELYSDEDYVTESLSDWARKHAEILGVPFEPRPFEALKGAVVRAQWLFSKADAEAFMKNAPKDLEVAQSTSPLMPDTQFISLTGQGVSKGGALRTLAAEYGVDLRDVMYVGDSGNDLSALQIVGHPIAMANAEPAILAAVKRSVGHVDEGGLVEALELALACARSSTHARDASVIGSG